MKRRTVLLAGVAAATFPACYVRAAGYPTGPVKLIVPFAPGGTVDFMARVISEPLAKELGQPVVVENKGGAGGIIGAMEVVRAPADGYTLLMASPSITGANPAFNPNAGYDPTVDLTPIVIVAAGSTMLAVRSGFPATNYHELIAQVRKSPGRYSYASPGVGGILHLQMEYFKSLTGTSITHVPFRGAGPAEVAVTSGQVDMLEDALPSMLPFVKAGKLVPIAVTAPSRISELPNVPTFAELGLAPLNQMSDFGILGPKGLSKEVVDVVNAAVRRAVNQPDVRKRIEDSGAVVVASSPQDYAVATKELYTHLKAVVAERHLKAE